FVIMIKAARVLGLGVVLCAWLVAAAQGADPPIRGFSTNAARAEREIEGLLAARLNRDSTGAFFRYLTAEPHAAGTARNKHLAEWIAERYRAYGLEDVKLHKYDVLLPWPTH